MLHQPAAPPQSDPAFLFKRQLGVWMFLVYSVFYVGFVVINLAWPSLMGLVVLAGLNLAVVFGMGLIILALVLALVYDRACRRKEEATKPAGGPGGRA
jgi:uncharacterized membrane protein (DUF485 family)